MKRADDLGQRPRRSHGQILVWYALILTFVVLPLCGLAIDVGLMFTAHRRLQMVTDGAARVGAMQVDQAMAYRDNRAALNAPQAQAAAESYLAQVPGVSGTALANPDQIQVRATRLVPLPFGSLVGRGPTQIAAVASAVPCPGITHADGIC